MRILVVSQRYWPEQFQVTSICEGLAERGHDVTVLCGLPNVGVPGGKPGRVLSGYRRGANREQERNGVRIVRCFEVGRREGLLFRTLNYYSFWKSALLRVSRLEGPYDVVLGYQLSPAMMCVPAARYASRRGVPFFLYCCDLWPESMKAMLGDRLAPIVDHYDRVCRRMYRQADAIGIQSPTFAGYFSDHHGIPGDRLVYIPQFSTDADGGVVPLVPHEGTNILFMGNMGAVQCVDMMVEAMSLVGESLDMSLHFVGDGSELASARGLAGRLGISARVVFHGRQPLERMREYYATADICVLGLDDATLIGTTIPSKLQGYMVAGRAVVGAVRGGARYVIEDSGCGIAVDPGDAGAFARALLELASDPKRRGECAERGRRYAEEHFSRAAYLDAIEDQLTNLTLRKGQDD